MGSLSLWKERLKVALSAMKCHESWTLPLSVSRLLVKSLKSTRPATAATGTVVYANCPPVGSIGFRRYLQGLKRIARGEHVPLAAHVSVTDRCGYRCDRCSNLSQDTPDPSTESVSGLMYAFKAAGVASVAFTGGEPNLREDLPAIVAAAGEDLAPMLFTSGQMLDRSRADTLRSAGLIAAFVSLDHFSPKVHDAIRGVAGAFEDAVAAIHACLAAGMYTAAQAVVGPALIREDEMERFLQFCSDLGVHDVVLLEPIPVGCRARCGTIDGKARRMLSELHLRSTCDRTLPKVTAMSFTEGPTFLGCQAGFSFFYVSTGGDVFPCDFAPVSFGNIYELSYAEVAARLSRHFRTPSSDCFALCLKHLVGESEAAPIPWERANQVMRRYEPGEPADLMGPLVRRNEARKQ